MQFHHVAHAARGRLLFTHALEGVRLWESLSAAFPELTAACLMPDHLHVILPHDDPDNRLHPVLQGHSQLRNRQRRRSGALWDPRPPAEALPDALHVQRTVRYVHLNPCRAGLVRDPLAWPFSTHRDRCGFAGRPVVAEDRDPARFHAYVSGDPTVDIAGTPLPTRSFAVVTAAEVADHVAGLFRTDLSGVCRRGPARTAAAKMAWHLGVRDVDAIGATLGLSRPRVYALVAGVPARGARLRDPYEAAARVVGDARFTALTSRDLRWLPGGGRYRTRE